MSIKDHNVYWECPHCKRYISNLVYKEAKLVKCPYCSESKLKDFNKIDVLGK